MQNPYQHIYLFHIGERQAMYLVRKAQRMFEGILDIADKVILVNAMDDVCQGMNALKEVLKKRRDEVAVRFFHLHFNRFRSKGILFEVGTDIKENVQTFFFTTDNFYNNSLIYCKYSIFITLNKLPDCCIIQKSNTSSLIKTKQNKTKQNKTKHVIIDLKKKLLMISNHKVRLPC